MPIKVDSAIRVYSEHEFHAIAEKVIGIVFDIHNDFGRLMDEDVYKQMIRRRCEATGIVPARREVKITVSHLDFEKKYFMDLLFAYGLMIEAKTVERLTKAHHAQTIQYLLLAGMKHGLLVNLRPGRVDKQFVSTTLDLAERCRYSIRDSDWVSVNSASARLRQFFVELLMDWGAFLRTTLYREAIIHFFGGPEIALRKVAVYDGDHKVGTHEVCLLADDTALALTGLKDDQDAMGDHLRRFLKHTKLNCLQWINMDNHDIEFRTLTQ
jgi:GxxExxY protein